MSEDLTGLAELHKTLEDASQVIAAFISIGRSGEAPIDSLLTAADQALVDLTEHDFLADDLVADLALAHSKLQ